MSTVNDKISDNLLSSPSRGMRFYERFVVKIHGLTSRQHNKERYFLKAITIRG